MTNNVPNKMKALRQLGPLPEDAYAYYNQHMTDGKIQIIVNDN